MVEGGHGTTGRGGRQGEGVTGSVWGVNRQNTARLQSVMTASSSSSFLVHWKAAAEWNWTPKEGLGCYRTCISNEQKVLSIPELLGTESGSLCCFITYVSLTT